MEMQVMNMEEYNKRNNEITTEAYRVIRRKVSDFEDNTNNDEISGFVKGVVALQSELYCNLNRELDK